MIATSPSPSPTDAKGLAAALRISRVRTALRAAVRALAEYERTHPNVPGRYAELTPPADVAGEVAARFASVGYSFHLGAYTDDSRRSRSLVLWRRDGDYLDRTALESLLLATGYASTPSAADRVAIAGPC